MTPRRKALITLLKLADLAVITATLIMSAAIALDPFHHSSWSTILQMRITIGNVLFVLGYLITWHFILKAAGLYRSYRLSPTSREFKDLGIAVLIAVAPLVPLDTIFHFEYVNSIFLTVFGGLTFMGLAVERRMLRSMARSARRHGHNLRNVIVVGDGAQALGTSSKLARRNDLGYRVIEVLEVPGHAHSRYDGNGAANGAANGASNGSGNGLGDNGLAHSPIDPAKRTLERLAELLETQSVDEVFVALPLDSAQSLIWPVIALCEEQGVMVRVLARVADPVWGRAVIDEVGGKPVITIFSGPPDTPRLIAKRLVDLVGSVLGLIVLSPLFLIVAIAIKIDSRGPAWFGQDRVGFNRRRFRAWKFRTMVQDAEQMQAALEPLNEADGPVFKIRNDPRVTRVGRFLRRASIDELPQLVNVLKGEMSLVGPRPLPVRDVNRIDVRWHKRRFSVKPGITCLWQANGRVPTFDEWIESDMEYIDHWSLTLDMKILLKTIPAVLTGQGAH